MYATGTIIGLLAVVALVLVSGAAARRRPSRGLPARLRPLEILIYAALLLSSLILWLTGFQAAGLRDEPLSGYLLSLHLAAGDGFLACLAVLAVLWAERSTFGANGGPGGPARKVCFWGMLLFGLLTAATMLLAMLPRFGTDGQRALLVLHRWSGLLLIMALVGHVSLAWLDRRRRRSTGVGNEGS